ncbi:MAG: sulfatase-like hydrolase/transferase [Pacificimonas sp.]|nr:sulfatase-like hydrolase/transferase [Pacificimonas sp.]
MSKRPNILFIMADQLRADYLGCYGHETIRTPNLDRLARSGVRFSRAYCQSTVCGPSRMSFYTGRYVGSHGATWNDTPLAVGEMTLGDHLAATGYRTVLVGKTHMRADEAGMARLGIQQGSTTGQRIAECGFEPELREEGIYNIVGDQSRHANAPYNQWLKEHGYEGDNPWHTAANSVTIDGKRTSGWYLDASPHPANVAAEHSETAYLTEEAIACIDRLGSADPWCIHLSYIKPHWPYIAPAPYHAMYDADAIQKPQRHERERTSPHPVYAAFQNLRVSQAFSDDAVREAVIPAYMGLVSELDDHIGKLLAALEVRNLLDDTIIVFTSDHGDYLGDHWLGEKDFPHEPSIRIPLIIRGPGLAEGHVSDALVEAIDCVPTFVDFAGGDAEHPRLEGRSLTPMLLGYDVEEWRETAFSEYDYSVLRVRDEVGQPIDRANFVTAVTERYKLIHFPGMSPMLFDLHDDPEELRDLGDDPDHAHVRELLTGQILDWSLRPRRVTESSAAIERRTDTQIERGILLGLRDEADHADALAAERARGAERLAKAGPV